MRNRIFSSSLHTVLLTFTTSKTLYRPILAGKLSVSPLAPLALPPASFGCLRNASSHSGVQSPDSKSQTNNHFSKKNALDEFIRIEERNMENLGHEDSWQMYYQQVLQKHSERIENYLSANMDPKLIVYKKWFFDLFIYAYMFLKSGYQKDWPQLPPAGVLHKLFFYFEGLMKYSPLIDSEKGGDDERDVGSFYRFLRAPFTQPHAVSSEVFRLAILLCRNFENIEEEGNEREIVSLICHAYVYSLYDNGKQFSSFAREIIEKAQENNEQLLLSYMNLCLAQHSYQVYKKSNNVNAKLMSEHLLESVMKKHYQFSYPYTMFGKLFFKSGEIEEAEKLLQKAINFNPSDFEASATISLICAKKKEYSIAIRAISKAIMKYPQQLEYLRLRAEYYFRGVRDTTRGMIDLYHFIARSNLETKSVQDLELMVIHISNQMDFQSFGEDKAKQLHHILKSIVLMSNSSVLHNGKEIIELLEMARSIDGNSPEIHYIRSSYHFHHTEDFETSFEHINKAISISPSLGVLYTFRATILWNILKLDSAHAEETREKTKLIMEDAAKAIRIDNVSGDLINYFDNVSDILMILSQIALSIQKNPAEALRFLNELTRKACHHNYEIYMLKGHIYANHRMWKKAILNFSAAISLCNNENLRELLYLRGMAHHKLGEREKAQLDIKKAESLSKTMDKQDH